MNVMRLVTPRAQVAQVPVTPVTATIPLNHEVTMIGGAVILKNGSEIVDVDD